MISKDFWNVFKERGSVRNILEDNDIEMVIGKDSNGELFPIIKSKDMNAKSPFALGLVYPEEDFDKSQASIPGPVVDPIFECYMAIPDAIENYKKLKWEKLPAFSD